MAEYQKRIVRLNLVESGVPYVGQGGRSPDAGALLERFGDHDSGYRDCRSQEARRRAIQRDLVELVNCGRIVVANPGGRPLRYRRCRENVREDAWFAPDTVARLKEVVGFALPKRQLDRVWKAALDPGLGLSLSEDRLRVVSDSVHLQSAEIHDEVLVDVLCALSGMSTLKVRHCDRSGKHSTLELHPQALLQRGPRVYLYALENDEPGPVRCYSLHRFVKSGLGYRPARRASGFSLDPAGEAVAGAGGQLIDLEMRARGDLAELLFDCPLAPGQRIFDEPDGGDFTVRVQVRVRLTGELSRWLLGYGSSVEVLAPASLRAAIAAHSTDVAALYRMAA